MKTSLALITFAAAALQAEPVARDINWVSQRVAALAPTKDERRLDEIGWAPSLLEAERLSKSSRRPVFLFTHDGRMGTGRC